MSLLQEEREAFIEEAENQAPAARSKSKKNKQSKGVYGDHHWQ